MKKWVIKKNSFNKNEVWRYIDTVEEAKRYFYVAEAIKKYGVDDILPVAVNRLGGYHSLHYDIEHGNIVKIIESDEEPVLELVEAWNINEDNFKCGWVSPGCITYSCGYMEHISLATYICSVIYHRYGMCADDFLFSKGWIKVYNEGWTGDFTKINDNQIKFMEDKKIKHHVYKDYDYEQLKDFRRDFTDWYNNLGGVYIVDDVARLQNKSS